MTDFTKDVIFGGSNHNIILPKLQIPIQHCYSDRYLEKLTGEQLMDSKYFVTFNKLSPLNKSRLPIRHSFIYRGASSLMAKKENPRSFQEVLESFIFTNSRYERGFKLHLQEDPHYLPIPYPRYFSTSKVSIDGLLTPESYEKKDFV